jgi:ribonuclease P protein component
VGPSRAVSSSEEGPEEFDGEGTNEARRELTSERLPRDRRLVRGDLVRQVLARGRRRRTAYFDVVWTGSESGHPRLGLIVPRFQSTAVARNRLRRRIKEIWRREIQQAGGAGPVDVVVRARREAYDAGFAELRAAFLEWAARFLGPDRCGR